MIARVGRHETKWHTSALENGGDWLHSLIDQIDVEQCGREELMHRQGQGREHGGRRADRFESAVLDNASNLHPDC